MENTSATSPAAPARAGFSAWLKGETGSVLAGCEKEKLERILPGLFGYHIVQVGYFDGGVVDSAGRIRNKIKLRLDDDGFPHNGCTLAAGAAFLPFAAHSIDVVVMPHVLEYVSDPGAVMKEVERVLVEDGRVIITGFSPWSLWGLWRLNPAVRARPPWNGRFHSVAKLMRWLTPLGFEVVEASRFRFRSPRRSGNRLRRLRFLETLGEYCWPFPGAAYIMVVQKRRAPVTPLKINWREKMVLSGASTGSAAMTEAEESFTTDCDA